MNDSIFHTTTKMCWEKRAVLAVVIILAILIIMTVSRRDETLTDTIDLNGVKIKVARDPYGWLTSGADLRDQTVFSSTNQ